VRKLLPNVKLLQCYGLSETGFLTVSKIRNMSEASSSRVGACPGIDLRVEDETGREVEVEQHGNWSHGAPRHAGYWNDPETRSRISRRNVSHGDIAIRIRTAISTSHRLKDMIVTVAKMFIPARLKRHLQTSRGS